MKMTPYVDILRLNRAVAKRIGVEADVLIKAMETKEFWGSPGNLVDGEKPATAGTKINLRREFPGGPKHHLDKGWYVVGYSRRRKDGRWIGYHLARLVGGSLQTNSISCAEAFDLVEAFEVSV